MHTWLLCICLSAVLQNSCTQAGVFFPRGGSFGYLAAVAVPIDLPNRNIYMAFNFESNYGLPSNDSYNEWIDRWQLDQYFLGIGNNVTPINGRNEVAPQNLQKRYTRSKFYHSFIGYLELFGWNGTACLLRTICEVGAYGLDESNGVLGSLLRVLFMPTTSESEQEVAASLAGQHAYAAEAHGRTLNCSAHAATCPHGVIDMITNVL